MSINNLLSNIRLQPGLQTGSTMDSSGVMSSAPDSRRRLFTERLPGGIDVTSSTATRTPTFSAAVSGGRRSQPWRCHLPTSSFAITTVLLPHYRRACADPVSIPGTGLSRSTTATRSLRLPRPCQGVRLTSSEPLVRRKLVLHHLHPCILTARSRRRSSPTLGISTPSDETFDASSSLAAAAGVETAGTLAEMRSIGIPAIFPDVSTDRVHVTLVEMADHLTHALRSALRHCRRQLQKRGVDVRAIRHITAEVREFRAPQGRRISGRHGRAFWAAGVGALGVPVTSWGFEQGRGGRIARRHPPRQRPSHLCCRRRCRNTEDPKPQLAHPAIQGGGVRCSSDRSPRARAAGRIQRQARWRRSTAIQPSCGCPAQVRGIGAWLTRGSPCISSALLGGRNRLQAMINLGALHVAPSSRGRGHRR